MGRSKPTHAGKKEVVYVATGTVCPYKSIREEEMENAKTRAGEG
jgi:hypothetical protein